MTQDALKSRLHERTGFQEQFDCLESLDSLIAIYEQEGRPPTVKELQTVRAKFCLDLAPLRDRPMVHPPILEEEAE